MPTQEKEDKRKEEKETPTKPEQPGAAQAAARERKAAEAIANVEVVSPENTTSNEPPEMAREIAQKYLETIPEADKKLTDPKQVERLLYVIENSNDPRCDLFAPTDKLGNMPQRVFNALENGDAKRAAQGWRDFSEDPVGIANETDKVDKIANSALPESVRNALLSIILKEGDYSAVAMAQEAANVLEQTGDRAALKQLTKKYSSPEAFKATALRQAAARELLRGLYPDLVEGDEMGLFKKMSSLSFDQQQDKSVVLDTVGQYVQLAGAATFARQYRELGNASNGKELLAKLQDGSISDRDVGRVIGTLQRELRKFITTKASSTEAK